MSPFMPTRDYATPTAHELARADLVERHGPDCKTRVFSGRDSFNGWFVDVDEVSFDYGRERVWRAYYGPRLIARTNSRREALLALAAAVIGPVRVFKGLSTAIIDGVAR